MKKSSINITNILPLIILIAINIVLGLGAARANGQLTQVESGRDAKSKLSFASRLDNLNSVWKEGLVRVVVHKDADVKGLVSDVLANHLLG